MSDQDVRAGGCRCGRVRFEATGNPLLTTACHCTGCQHMSASAYSLSEGYPSSAFRLTQGDTVIGGLHGDARHYHCDYCKSWLYTQMDLVPDFTNVRLTAFDEPRQEPPFVETQTAEGLSWAKTGAEHSFERFPEMDEWPGLMQRFAARQPVVKG